MVLNLKKSKMVTASLVYLKFLHIITEKVKWMCKHVLTGFDHFGQSIEI